MRLALYQPDIPQNTGTILRLAACLDVPVDVISPCGFDLSERSLRRSGLDYLDQVSLTRHASWEAFDAWRRSEQSRLLLLTTHARERYDRFRFRDNDILMLGRESAGVPALVHHSSDARLRVPMRPGLRSLNVALTAALVLGEAMRQTGGLDRLE